MKTNSFQQNSLNALAIDETLEYRLLKKEWELQNGCHDREAITLKVFSNLPDRKNGQGLVEQTIIDEYMTENPNVTIEVGHWTKKHTKQNLKHMLWMVCWML